MTAETIAIETTTDAPEIDTATLAEIEEKVVTGVSLGDLFRQGAEGTVQADGWGQGNEACFLSAAALRARDLGYIA